MRPPIPSLRALAVGILALVPLLGAGLVVWALPLTQPLGRPGTFLETPVTPTDLRVQRANNSPVIAADPTTPQFVVLAHRTDGPEPACGLQVSGDGGDTWVGANPVPALPAGVERCYAPVVSFDRRGTLYFLFVGLAGAGRRPIGVFLTTSGDRAGTFTPPHQVLGPRSYGVQMAVDPEQSGAGRVHLAWLQAGDEPTAKGFASVANSVMTAHSDDGGSRFSEPLAVSGPPGRRVAAPALAAATGGRVSVAYYDLGDDARDYEGRPGLAWEGRWSLAVATSRNGGGRFDGGVVVDDSIAPASRVRSIFTMPPPGLAAGRERTCLAWTDARYGDPDVFLRCAPENGRWTDPQRVNDDQRDNGVWQYLPQVGIAPSGRIDVAFYDRRGNLSNDRTSLGFSYSYDGRRFSGNAALSRFLGSATVGPALPYDGGDGPVELGSRLGLLSQESSALTAWADARNTREGAVNQDVYAARASLLFAAERPGWALAAGAVLMVVGGGAPVLVRRRTRRKAAA